MAEQIRGFYDELAEYYHLIFENWDDSIERQAKILGPLLASQGCGTPSKILDCTCGIGTQTIGLATIGHRVVASDISKRAVDRARREAQRRSLEITFHVSDVTSLKEIAENNFDAVATMDNALPHLSLAQLGQAAQAIASKLKPNGLLMASIRDYDALILDRPTIQSPAFHGAPGNRRIVHQVWDWIDDRRYIVHLYITVESGRAWQAHHFVSEYRSLLREELSNLLREAGFTDIRWILPAESGYYLPLVLARRSS
ncbi:MAG TPA: methyltransferase domain-containing protein [Terracidiphilus sp.]|nr:methyltransferase domain-containing protein [Terracidiphilus sp.]